MKTCRSLCPALVLSLYASSILYGAPGTESLEAGKVITKVVCREFPDQSYALYLPSRYTPDTEWPILYALDPGARGTIPLEQLRQAAESYGYIVAGSNNARNGPFGPIYAAVMAMWNDTHSRLSLDPKRVYAIGFSGGARAASAFAQIIGGPVTAVIGCGAGLHPRLQPRQLNADYYLGLVGIEDFNYLEMKRVGRMLEEDAVPHRIVVFEGGHEWPPAEVCGRALAWLEALAMRNGLRPRDEQLSAQILNPELEQAVEWEESGRVYLAASAYADLLDVFPEGPALDDVGKRMDRLLQDERYESQRRVSQEALDIEQASVDAYRGMLLRVEGQPQITETALSKLLSEAGFDSHREEAERRADPDVSARALRLLFGLELDARDKALFFLRQEDHRRAVTFLNIALAANPGVASRRSVLHYYLACAHALAGEPDRAIGALKNSVADGFQDADALEREPYFDSLRETAEFMEIVRTLRTKK